jgi:murein DD-endopeptidase MepM/ murein hydrolase activator NlpD
MAGNLRNMVLVSTATLALAACGQRFDADLRNNWGNAFDTSDAARQAAARPRPDNRGVISYPNYQVVVAQRGETVTQIAGRLGQSADQLSRFNGIDKDVPLRAGEIIALPDRVAEPSPATGSVGTGPIRSVEDVDVTTLAAAAIDAAETETSDTPPAQTATERRAELPQTGQEPIRHKVAREETAYSISRLYQVSVRSLADWNGLGADRAIREGQFLLIPVSNQPPPRTTEVTTNPGAGSPTPTPPSASQPLPPANTTAIQTLPTPPAIGQTNQASASNARMVMPVQGPIIRAFKKGRSEGIDIGATAGAPVVAAASGTIAAITEDTDKVPILVIRHPNNILTVYANIDGIKFAKGAIVQRGQPIAVVRAGDPAFVHFEVREGFDAVDPSDYLN